MLSSKRELESALLKGLTNTSPLYSRLLFTPVANNLTGNPTGPPKEPSPAGGPSGAYAAGPLPVGGPRASSTCGRQLWAPIGPRARAGQGAPAPDDRPKQRLVWPLQMERWPLAEPSPRPWGGRPAFSPGSWCPGGGCERGPRSGKPGSPWVPYRLAPLPTEAGEGGVPPLCQRSPEQPPPSPQSQHDTVAVVTPAWPRGCSSPPQLSHSLTDP